MITLQNLHLITAERTLVETALAQAGSISGAGELLGISRHAVKRQIIKHNIRWVRPHASSASPAVPERAPS